MGHPVALDCPIKASVRSAPRLDQREALPVDPRDSEILTCWLQFRNVEFETAYMAGQAAKALSFDRIFVIFKDIFIVVVTLKIDSWRMMSPLLFIYTEHTIQTWLVWMQPTFWVRHRVLLASIWKGLRLPIVRYTPIAFRADASSWQGALRVLLLQSDICGALLCTYGYSTTFWADLVMQSVYVVTAVSTMLHTANAQHGFCTAGADGLIGKVHAAMQRTSEALLTASTGGPCVTPQLESSFHDPCLVIVIFIHVYIVGLVPMVIAWAAEHRNRLRWWQTRTRSSLAPEATPRWILLLYVVVALLVNGVTLFSAINAIAHTVL